MSEKKIISINDNQVTEKFDFELFQVVEKFLEIHMSENFSPLKNCFEEKKNLINEASDMSTKEKLEAYERIEDKYLLNLARYFIILSITVSLPITFKKNGMFDFVAKNFGNKLRSVEK